jgi:hypothetical protein
MIHLLPSNTADHGRFNPMIWHHLAPEPPPIFSIFHYGRDIIQPPQTIILRWLRGNPTEHFATDLLTAPAEWPS